MGTFSVQIAVGDPDRGRWTTLDALVGTGASITSVPASVLRDLGVAPMTRRRFRFAQGETRMMDVGQTWVRVEGRERITLVLFNEEGTPPLLGALALEGVFMGVDPVGQKLVPVEGLMASVSLGRLASGLYYRELCQDLGKPAGFASVPNGDGVDTGSRR